MHVPPPQTECSAPVAVLWSISLNPDPEALYVAHSQLAVTILPGPTAPTWKSQPAERRSTVGCAMKFGQTWTARKLPTTIEMDRLLFTTLFHRLPLRRRPPRGVVRLGGACFLPRILRPHLPAVKLLRNPCNHVADKPMAAPTLILYCGCGCVKFRPRCPVEGNDDNGVGVIIADRIVNHASRPVDG